MKKPAFQIPDEPILTTADAAARVGQKAWTVKEKCQAGQVRGAFKAGQQWRIPLSSLGDVLAPLRDRKTALKSRKKGGGKAVPI
jgi:hypothetical protein